MMQFFTVAAAATSAGILILSLTLINTAPSCNAFTTTNSIFRTTVQVTTPTSKYPNKPSTLQFARRRRDDRDDFYDDDDEDYYYDDDDFEPPRPQRRRSRNVDNLNRSPSPNTNRDDTSLNLPSPFGRPSGLRLPDSVSKALLAGVFVLGIGTGVTVDSQINTSPKDLASRDAVDQAAPNPRLCSQYGASAMAFDQRVFVSFNPFNVYVAQADVKPACVLRPSNVVSVLQDKGLVNEKEVRSCKQNMNTWAFVGELEDYPQLSCVYKSEDAQNEFLSNPKYGIGEDVYDDDRVAVLEAAKAKKMGSGVAGAIGKNVKGEMTEGEKAMIAKKAAALRVSQELEDTSINDMNTR